MSSGQARFSYSRYNVPNADSQKVTAVIPAGGFRNFLNIEGSCGGIYHYLFLSGGEMGINGIACMERSVSTIIIQIRNNNDKKDTSTINCILHALLVCACELGGIK